MPQIKTTHRLLQLGAWIIALIWTLVILSVGLFNALQYQQTAEQLALNEARVSVKKDLAYRTWVSVHGGVYVPVDAKTPPNPYLSHIPNRDVTLNGKRYTLMNPAYTLSQMMQDYGDLYGVKGKITSRILLNPDNAADPWETQALQQIERTREPFYQIKPDQNHRPALRYMNPLVTEKSCLKCHGHQGYQVGDIRGGVAVAIPMQRYYAVAERQTTYLAGSLLVIWILGLLLLYFGHRKLSVNIAQRIDLYEQVIYSLVDIIEQRDSYTAGHTRRVAHYSQLIARQMGLSEAEITQLYRAAMLHDIGKISTPDSVLLKPGHLSPLEYTLIQQHVTSSYEILHSVDMFQDLAEIVRHHHERYDGQGYPQGLKGDEIPIIAYILSLADAFDAMTSDRVYKGRKTVAEALNEIKRNQGTQFHPQVAQAALNALQAIQPSATPAHKPQSILEQARFAYFYRDQLTGAYNRTYLDHLLSHPDNDTSSYRCAYGVYLHHVTDYNRQHGWNQGNRLLKAFAEELKERFPQGDIFRLFGDDFIVLHDHHCAMSSQDKFESLQNSGVTLSVKHLDLHESILTFEALEEYLQKTTEYG